MGLYQKEVFIRDKTGQWNLKSSTIEKAPHDLGRWEQTRQLENNSNLGEKTYFDFAPTKTGLNQKVTRARTYFGKNEKVVRTLITTANKLPRNRSRS